MLAALLYRIRAKIKAALPPNRNGEAARLMYQPIALAGLQSPAFPCCAITPAPTYLCVLVLSGGDLFSHSVTRAVSSALGRFTSVFGMGTGGATPLEPPESNGTIMPHKPPLGKGKQLRNFRICRGPTGPMLYWLSIRGPPRDGPLAQLAEHRTFNPGVVGSIPTRPTKLDKIKNLFLEIRVGPVGYGVVSTPWEWTEGHHLYVTSVLCFAKLLVSNAGATANLTSGSGSSLPILSQRSTAGSSLKPLRAIDTASWAQRSRINGKSVSSS